MVARTQITLHPEQHRRAKARAADLGISLAEYIRRLVDRDLDRPMAVPDPSTIFNLGDSGGSDVAAHKDAYVNEAVVAEAEREVGRRPP
jgi:hypothetical protein